MKFRRRFQKSISIFLALVLCLSVLPVGVAAAGQWEGLTFDSSAQEYAVTAALTEQPQQCAMVFIDGQHLSRCPAQQTR